jgi:hypothetical protein
LGYDDSTGSENEQTIEYKTLGNIEKDGDTLKDNIDDQP